MSVVIAASALTKTFDVEGVSLTAVRNVSFEVQSGDFVGLVGPSGCGKSTLLNIVGLADRPSSGELFIQERKVHFSAERELVHLRRTAVGFVFQHFNLLPTLSAVENVMLPLVLSGSHAAPARLRAIQLLEQVGLASKVDALPFRLSGGEMQRVAVARAVAHRPAIVLADEPTGNLDSVSGESVLGLLSNLVQDGTAVVMATHSDVAIARCSRIVRLKDGELA